MKHILTALMLFTVCGCARPSSKSFKSAAKVLTIQAANGNNQVGEVGSSLPQRFQLVVNVSNDPYPGANVTWETDAGTLDTTSSVTDAEGLAIGPILTLPDKPKVVHIKATVTTPEHGSKSIVFIATGRIGGAAKLTFLAEPENTLQFDSLPPVQVQVTDDAGNAIPDAADLITVGLTGNKQLKGQLFGATTANAEAGIATFKDLSINQIGSGYTLVASAQKMTPKVSKPFNITDAGWTVSPVAENPASTKVNSSLELQVQVKTNAGKTIAGLLVEWRTVTGGGSLSRSSSFTDADGIAKIIYTTGLTAGINSISALIHVGQSPASTELSVLAIPGQAQKLIFIEEPTTSKQYNAFLAPPKVGIIDEQGNIDTTQNIEVTLSLQNNSGNATLFGSVTSKAVSGLATFPGLFIDKVGSDYTLRASASDLQPADSAIFSITDIGLQTLAVSQADTEALVGTTLNSPFTVQVKDSNLTPIANVKVNWTVNTSDAALAAPFQSVTDTDGIAKSPNLTLSSFPEINTTLAYLTLNPSAPPASFTVRGVAKLVFNTFPQTPVRANSSFDVVVDLRTQTNTIATATSDLVILSAIPITTNSGNEIALGQARPVQGQVKFSAVKIPNPASYLLKAKIVSEQNPSIELSTSTVPIVIQ